MFHSIKSFAILSTSLIISCASGPSGMTFDSPVGVWSEQYSTMSGGTKSSKVTIVDETKGTYTNPKGRIEFYTIDQQGQWKGYWIEESGSTSCSEEKNGSMFWGETTFQFNDAYNHYTGTWDMCGDGNRAEWNGSR